MRTFFISLILLATSFSLAAQSMETFFKYRGVEMLGSLAHPLSTYKSGSYAVESDRVTVLIVYEEGKTQITLGRNGDFLHSLHVDYDNFGTLWRPFTGVSIARDLLTAMLQEDQASQTFASQLERAFGKHIEQMTGAELALVAINIEWFGY